MIPRVSRHRTDLLYGCRPPGAIAGTQSICALRKTVSPEEPIRHPLAWPLGFPARVRHLVTEGRLKAQHLTAQMLLFNAAHIRKLRVRKPGRPKKKP